MPTAKEILEGIRSEVLAEGHAKTASTGVNLDELSDSHFAELSRRFSSKAEKRAAVGKLVAEGEKLKNQSIDPGAFLKKAHKLAWNEALRHVGFKPGMTPLHILDRDPAVKLAQVGANAAITLLSAAFRAALDPRGFMEEFEKGATADE